MDSGEQLVHSVRTRSVHVHAPSMQSLLCRPPLMHYIHTYIHKRVHTLLIFASRAFHALSLLQSLQHDDECKSSSSSIVVVCPSRWHRRPRAFALSVRTPAANRSINKVSAAQTAHSRSATVVVLRTPMSCRQSHKVSPLHLVAKSARQR